MLEHSGGYGGGGGGGGEVPGVEPPPLGMDYDNEYICRFNHFGSYELLQ